jgi:hypothetical protein
MLELIIILVQDLHKGPSSFAVSMSPLGDHEERKGLQQRCLAES